MKKWLQSSQDPNKISTTVKGFVIGAGTLIIIIGGWLGIPLAEGDVATLATQLGLVASTLVTFYGAMMKIVMVFGKEK